MLKKIFILIILALIISTTLIKNHLNNVKELVKLEHDYLSSPERLLELNNYYFDFKLKKTPRENIKIITDISQLNLDINQNEQ